MSRALVTGGTGALGRPLVAQLRRAGWTVRVLSRHPPAPGAPDGEWVEGDLQTGAGLAAAVAGVDAIIHAATGPMTPGRVDIAGTRRLLAAARAAGTGHFVYPSIVGIEKIPLPYYKAKRAVEAVIAESGVPWSILRATQFHSFIVDRLLLPLAGRPVMPLATDLQFQPIDAREVAGRLCAALAAGPGGRLADIGGPEVWRLGGLARAWLAATGRRRLVIPLPLPGRIAAGYRRGYNTCPQGRYGTITWTAWLQENYGAPAAVPQVRAKEHTR